MAKKKQEQKFFNCETCSESDVFQTTRYCTLRNNDDRVPQLTSICQYILSCDWYRKKK